MIKRQNNMPCGASDINGCAKVGTIIVTDRRQRQLSERFCSKSCANEFCAEISAGTWCPFPREKGGLNFEQIAENLSYFRD